MIVNTVRYWKAPEGVMMKMGRQYYVFFTVDELASFFTNRYPNLQFEYQLITP